MVLILYFYLKFNSFFWCFCGFLFCDNGVFSLSILLVLDRGFSVVFEFYVYSE